MKANYLKPTPWDKRNFHIDTYELITPSEEALQQTEETEGHFTLKVDPAVSTEKLNEFGFYYVDTLIEPVCRKEDLRMVDMEGIHLSRDADPVEIIQIAKDVLKGGRFHRDFNIPDHMADRRYMNWVDDLLHQDLIITLIYKGKTAGFYAYEKDKVLLLGMKKEYQGVGLTKAFTSQGCAEQFRLGDDAVLRTSISPSNLPSLNLFLSLGFKMKKSVDVYHKLNGSIPAGV